MNGLFKGHVKASDLSSNTLVKEQNLWFYQLQQILNP